MPKPKKKVNPKSVSVKKAKGEAGGVRSGIRAGATRAAGPQ